MFQYPKEDMNCDGKKDLPSVDIVVTYYSVLLRAVYDVYYLLLTGIQYGGTGFEFY